MALKSDIKLLTHLSHTHFQHPLDLEARQALENIPWVKEVSPKISEWFAEGSAYRYHIANSVRVSSSQYPSLYSQYVKMARVLNLQQLPELFIANQPDINAYAMGQKKYFIVVTVPLIDLMTEDELLAVIGHEMGHIKCEHMLYSSTAEILKMTGEALLAKIPLPPFVKQTANWSIEAIEVALLEWYRKAEFSCDRAALLATQNLDAVCTMLTKLAGYSPNLKDPINLEGIRQQALDYEYIGNDSVLGKFMKLTALMRERHPYPILRVKEISEWANSNQYKQIMGISLTKRNKSIVGEISEQQQSQDRFLPMSKF